MQSAPYVRAPEIPSLRSASPRPTSLRSRAFQPKAKGDLARALAEEGRALDVAVVAAALGRRDMPGSVSLSDYFGAFVTAYWQGAPGRERVHGCIGFWDFARTEAASGFVRRLRDVASSALDSDGRGDAYRAEHAGNPIRYEPELRVKVSFMLRGNVQGPFDPKRHGIIATAEDGRRATFLPEVMEGKTWEQTLAALLEKAGIMETSPSYQLALYETHTHACSLLEAEEHVLVDVYGPNLSEAFVDFVAKHTSPAGQHGGIRAEGLPPLERLSDGTPRYDETELVRNTSTLADAILWAPRRKDDTRLLLGRHLERYLQRFVLPSGPERGAQAASFAIEALGAVPGSSRTREQLCAMLSSRFSDMDAMDKTFELPEVAIGLVRCGVVKAHERSEVGRVDTSLDAEAILRRALDPSDVFSLNWCTQLARELDMQGGLVALVAGWEKLVLPGPTRTWPANVLAVTLEGLTFLRSMHAASPRLTSLWMRASAEVCRRGERSVLLITASGDRARLDISGHVLRAIARSALDRKARGRSTK